MVTYAAGLGVLFCGLLRAAVEYWRRGQRGIALLSATAGGVAAVALIAVIYLLRHTEKPWAWIGLPMACRYTLRGC
jgi:hypothetical protein